MSSLYYYSPEYVVIPSHGSTSAEAMDFVCQHTQMCLFDGKAIGITPQSPEWDLVWQEYKS